MGDCRGETYLEWSRPHRGSDMETRRYLANSKGEVLQSYVKACGETPWVKKLKGAGMVTG